ncbi:hypothetical protein LBW89_12595 [Paenibacillus sp. alder61]|uniref:Lipoprotein n=1 Tax=Paenibacillus faecis TaxID=862114 RepID=A0A5D0CZE0_9BACL|nr:MULTISPECIES: hypothetical protein [Paenibacillus]MCA1293858.1 hypothetical protein [Paenibacillus sp. alder61]TYA15439.1 hypothetical protein FRY98_07395 [Paenibacillus faecis]
MMTKFGRVVSILVLTALVGCSKAAPGQNANAGAQANVEPVQRTAASMTNEAKAKDGANEPDTTPLFKKFMTEKEKALGEDRKLFFFEKEDLDRDGLEEAVVAYGPSNDDLTDIYVLKNRDGQIVQLGDNLNSGGYAVDDIKLIQLDGRDNPMIYLGLTNWDSMTGFNLFELAGDRLENPVYSASATGAGEDVLLDTDNNGRFDRYEQRRYSYDVFYYEVTRTYTLQQGEFVHTDTSVQLPDYPASPEEVVEEYLALGKIDEKLPQNVISRRAELCRYCGVHPGKNVPQVDDGTMQSLILGLEEEGSALKVKEGGSGKSATATLVWTDKSGKQKETIFELAKTGDGNGGRWTITDMSAGEKVAGGSS